MIPTETTRESTSDIRDRFLSKVKEVDGHWIWQAGTDGSSAGYGRFSIGKRMYPAHRVSYTLFVGPIPESMSIHHKCFIPACVHPECLEACPKGENQRNQRGTLKTHCPKGHVYDEENTARWEGSGRQCRRCNRAATKDWYQRNRQAS